ncbi:MAG: hypothetical protein JO215_01270 [Ktedonobacteraceae bacterium]|nr:hypothetical protein [Ktedonobacteraceae bacterium]MBV9616700.1 hypothetical protein [Ktedonobacteraceae bacterium]MBV9710523.1 hypothetical protein [Ktedonobacteraceae bacterium]
MNKITVPWPFTGGSAWFVRQTAHHQSGETESDLQKAKHHRWCGPKLS